MTIEAARATQTVRIAVAPSKPLTVGRNGETLVLQPGDEVLASDFVAGSAVTHCLPELLNDKAVVYLPDHELGDRVLSTSARYVVAPGGSVSTTNRGVVTEGAEVQPSCFLGGQADVDDLVATWRNRRPQPGGKPMNTPQIPEWEFVRSGDDPWVVQSRDPARPVKARISDRTLHVIGSEPIPIPIIEQLLRLSDRGPTNDGPQAA
jgi:hypothetical protein